jgi:hypothetical protein
VILLSKDVLPSKDARWKNGGTARPGLEKPGQEGAPMTKIFRLLICGFCSVAVGAIPMALAGCGSGLNPAIPGSVSAEAFHAPDGRDAYRTIHGRHRWQQSRPGAG